MQEVSVVFDLGKSKKKLVVFDKEFNQVLEKTVVLDNILDEEGDYCEDLKEIEHWISEELKTLKENYQLTAINFTSYESGLVFLDKDNKPISPIYNYLKRFPKELNKQFMETHDLQNNIFLTAGSGNFGFLNAGLQMYWLKHKKPNIFKNVKTALFLPHYLSFIFTQKLTVDYTNLGSHSLLWNFENQGYLDWIKAEHLNFLDAELVKAETSFTVEETKFGVGISDNMAALVPYLATQSDAFVLISSGTWNVSLNPFNHQKLTERDLSNDCLNLLDADGNTVRAARVFCGSEHDRQIKHLSHYFNLPLDYYQSIKFDSKIVLKLRKTHKQILPNQTDLGSLCECPFVERNLNAFRTFEEAYHQFMIDLVAQQTASTQLTFGQSKPRKIFVDGGFSKNDIFMHLLSEAFFNIDVYASENAQASALGAAMVISTNTITENILQLKKY